MIKTNPKISIITPVFNGSKYLEYQIESVVNCKFPHFEHIVINDGSKDDGATANVLKKFKHLKTWGRENRGQYATMNEGLDATDGDFVSFLSADDLLVPESILEVIEIVRNNPDVEIIIGDYGLINTKGDRLSYNRLFRNFPAEYYPYFSHISHSSLFVKTEFLKSNHLTFDSTLRYVGDYDWILRIIQSRPKIQTTKSILSLIRVHPQQTSTTQREKMKAELIQVQKKHGINLLFASLVRKVMFFDRVLKEIIYNGFQAGFPIIKSRLNNIFLK